VSCAAADGGVGRGGAAAGIAVDTSVASITLPATDTGRDWSVQSNPTNISATHARCTPMA
jgi:hypothetical protein